MTYYLHNGQLFEIDRMPPDKQQYCGLGGGAAYEKDLDAFHAYLSTQPLITHTFSGESRVIQEDQIEWRYEFWTDREWEETTLELHDMTNPRYRRRVATPKITEGGTIVKCVCDTGEQAENCIRNCDHGAHNEPLTAQPGRQGEGIVLKPTGRHFYAYWSNGAYLGILLKEVHGSFVFEQSPKAGYMDANVLLSVSKELDRLNNVRPSSTPETDKQGGEEESLLDIAKSMYESAKKLLEKLK